MMFQRMAHLIIVTCIGLGTGFLISCAHQKKRTPATAHLILPPTQTDIIESEENHFNQYEKDPTSPAPPNESFSNEEAAEQAIQELSGRNNQKSYFDWPVDEARMTRGYIPKPTGKRRKPHWGLDLASARGTPILAAHDGTVIYVGKDFKGFGRMILIEGKKGWATLYAHLSKAHVNEGQPIRQGQIIGDMGNTGRATGVHLHFEIRKERGPVDPLFYLPHGRAFSTFAELNPEQVTK